MRPEIESDIVWVAIPFSKSELKKMAPHKGKLMSTGCIWEEIRANLRLQRIPMKFHSSSSHDSLLQVPYGRPDIDSALGIRHG